jgi:thermitase
MHRLKFLPLFLALFCLPFAGRAANPGENDLAGTNSITWDTAADLVSANLHNEPLFPLLQAIAHQTGWHIFVEPQADRTVSVKFRNASSGDALHKLLGNLNFALVPKTDEAWHLYVFTTRMENATRAVTLAAKPAAGKQKHVPNQLSVHVKPGTDIDALAKSVGAKVVSRDDALGLYVLEFPDAASTDAALAQLQGNSNVQSVGYNFIYDPPPTPQTFTGNAPTVPKLTADVVNPGNPCDPVIALIDTAFQPTGTSLDQFAETPISVVGNTTPSSTMTHATAMYQTILNALAQASGGHTGAKILPVNVFGSDGTATSYNVALGMQAAAANGATVFNMSLGGTQDDPTLDDVANQLLAQGVVMFAAAGNQPVNTSTFPAAIPGINAVTALSSPGQLASYANYGSFVSMALPGSSVVAYGGQNWLVQGTSPATAYATGLAVGTKGVNCASWSQIETGMQQKFPVPQGQQ